MMIQIDDRHRLQRKDPMNLELFELWTKKDGTLCWKSMGRYYQSLASALKAVYDMRVIASDFEGRPQGRDGRGAHHRARASWREGGARMGVIEASDRAGRWCR